MVLENVKEMWTEKSKAGGRGVNKDRFIRSLSEKNKQMRDRRISPARTKIRRATSFVNAEWCVEAEEASIRDERKQQKALN
jgi:hypothetical protein